MSDVMLFGVLKMPYEMAMADELSRRQFYDRVQELVRGVESQAGCNFCRHPLFAGFKCKNCGRVPAAEQRMNELTIADYEEVLADHRRLVRELDVLLNGEDGAAKQASLCDIVLQVRREKDL